MERQENTGQGGQGRRRLAGRDFAEFAELVRLLGCVCRGWIEARCGRRAAEIFTRVDMEGRGVEEMALSLGLPPAEVRDLLALARLEMLSVLCRSLALPAPAPASAENGPPGVMGGRQRRHSYEPPCRPGATGRQGAKNGEAR